MNQAIDPDASETGGRQPDRLALTLLAFAGALALFLLGPPLLRGDVGIAPHFTWQEAADLLTPIVVMPLAALVLELAGPPSSRVRLAFVAIAAAWVLGQGIHLGTNAIGDVFPNHAAAAPFYATAPGALDFWLDEVLSHWIWHVAWAGLLIVFVVGGWRTPRDAPWQGRRAGVLAALAGLIHGFTWAVVTVEGETAAMGIPTLGFLLLVAPLGRRSGALDRTLTTFLLASSVVAIALYGLWAAMNGGSLPGIWEWLQNR